MIFLPENYFSIDLLYKQIYVFSTLGKNQVRKMKYLNGLMFKKSVKIFRVQQFLFMVQKIHTCSQKHPN